VIEHIQADIKGEVVGRIGRRSIQSAFVGFLTALGEVELAETYRSRSLRLVKI
jgi:hypothetical protein